MSSFEFLNQPFSPPPPGVVPSQLNPQTQGYVMITTCSVFLAIMIVFVSVRVYAKLWIIRKVTWDDRIPCPSFSPISQQANFRHSDMSYRICMNHWRYYAHNSTDRRLSIASYGDLLCHLCKRYVGMSLGRQNCLLNLYSDALDGYVGYHSWDISQRQVAASQFYVVSLIFVRMYKGLLTYGELSYVQELVNPLSLGFIKLSFFILYEQLFRPLRRMRILIRVGATVCVIVYVLIFALNLYFSTPRRGETFITHFLNPVNKGGVHLSIPFATVGLVFDLVVITIPIYGVCQLQLSNRQKASTILVFMTGGS